MIFLIGGSSHTGKTYLAKELVKKTGFKYFSLDKFRSELIERKLENTPVNDDVKMRYFLWPFASEIIKSAIENKQNMIVEGCYIPGTWKSMFEEKYLSQIKCVFLLMSKDYITENFDLIKSKANVAEQRINDNPSRERLIMCSQNFKQDCIDNEIPFIEISEKFNIQDLVKTCLAYLP